MKRAPLSTGGAWSLTAALCLVLALAGCPAGSTPAPPEPPRVTRAINVELEHTFVTSTSALRFGLPYDLRFDNKTALIRFDGELLDGVPFQREFVALVELDEAAQSYYLELKVDQDLWEAISPAPDQVFIGSITVEVLDLLGAFAVGEVDNAVLEFASVVEPTITSLERPGQVWPGQSLALEGRGFLRPDEGTTWAIVERGTLTREGAAPVDLAGRRLPVRWTGQRDRAGMPALPQVFGIHPARVEGTLRFENELADGQSWLGSRGVRFEADLQEPRVDAISPDEASRSQVVRITGRGFLPTDQSRGYGMLLRYEGTFTPLFSDRTIDYRARRAIQRSPLRVVDERLIEQDIWYTVNGEDFTLEGLGAQPGVFEGRIVPILLHEGDEEVGAGLRVSFDVRPSRQVVHIKFMPSFSESLVRYGLNNVEAEVRDRILAVLRRDYEGINIEFVEEPPRDFLDYMTLEIGGPDPTGRNLLGYDNSFNGVPKDTGNLFLKDYLGGYNRDSQDANFSPYGGVFIESFVIFSPTLAEDGFEVAPRFDEIMGPFMPELGGRPVSGTEWPEGPRAERIEQAILLIGNLAGHTATHEIGHSLGLPYVPDEDPDDVLYHNKDLGRAYIMDTGISRPFAERAELDGEGPATFSPENRRYLRLILPK